ncbi:hypothetical protein [Vibrio phage ICP2]|uniref:Uncharacterized protein 69 n=1 Tax=Vibrio phage ICP2 TaxID=979533 RepID=F1D0S7_9CAUD|nr:hypothetical protein ViPhICP2p68 [Vibrio phage ICP2]ADX87750.1 hypothetical protein [Vibrio phage ICP2]
MSTLLSNCSAIIGSKADSNLLRNNANKDANCIHVMQKFHTFHVSKRNYFTLTLMYCGLMPKR